MSRSWAGPAQSPLGRLRALALPLAEGCCRQRRDPRVPTTTRTEQAIGRFRIRARARRGIKGWEGLEAALLLPQLTVTARKASCQRLGIVV